MNYGLLPVTAGTVVVSPAGPGAAAVSGLKRGVLYRVVATGAITLSLDNGTAVAKAGIYLPANVPEFLMFGSGDSQGTDPAVSVYGAADVYFTPMVKVSQ